MTPKPCAQVPVHPRYGRLWGAVLPTGREVHPGSHPLDFLYDRDVIDTLQSEIDRLRDDRNCEKRIRKDAEAAREDLIVEVARLNAEVASLLSGVRIRIPTRAMDQEIATHERRVVALERERCASLAESWPNYHISVTSIGPQIARQIRGAKP